MFALDTNLIVRLLVEDDVAQSGRAAKLVRKAIDRSEQLFVSDIVMCEVVWVLRSGYGFGRTEIADVLQHLLRATHLAFASSGSLKRAAEPYGRGRGDFSDYVIREHARTAGCERVATFDRALLKEEHFAAP
jgi:predicted nucleic-acid-binding protein